MPCTPGRRLTGKLLPTRSTIHDLGSTISHKREIVALHLQGYLTSEIARMTNHDPHNVDRYLRDFERVYDMARDGASLNKICFLTGLSPRLVKEYLGIIQKQRKRSSRRCCTSSTPGHS